MALSSRSIVALTLATAAAAVTGAIVLIRRRRGSGLGQVVSKTETDGMTMTHHRDKHMPIEKRVKIIQDMVWEGVQDPTMRKLALGITASCPERDGNCEAKAIYNYTKKHVRYTGDIAPVKMGANGPVEGVDLFQSAKRTLEFGGGDCDDHSIVNSVLLALNGITPKLRVTSPKKGGEFSHIYTIAGIDSKMRPSKWVALDTTLPGNRYNFEVPFGRNADFPA